MPDTNHNTFTIIISDEQLALLKRHRFPCSEQLLATARRTAEGFELTGRWLDFDTLVGWVAGEANHVRKTRRPNQTDLLDDIADQLESVLAYHRANG